MRRPFFREKIFLLGLLLTLVLQASSWGAQIVVLQSARIPAYDEALQGLVAVLSQDIPKRGQKAIQAHTITTHILSEAESTVQLRQQMVEAQPDLLVAIGSSSLSLVKDLAQVPILYLMVPFPEIKGESRHITGVNMNLSAAQQLEALAAAAPGVASIGLLYDPARSGAMVDEAREHAARINLDLVTLPVRSAGEVPAQLARLKGRIEWLWMVPDITVLTPQNVDYILLFSMENRVPIFTFAKKYLDQGAALSVSFDTVDMGKQAGELACKILNGTMPADLPPEAVRKVVVEINANTLKMLGIVFQEREGEKR